MKKKSYLLPLAMALLMGAQTGQTGKTPKFLTDDPLKKDDDRLDTPV